AHVPSEVFFRVQAEIHPENFILTARRAKSRGNARVECRIGFVDLLAAGYPVSPHVAELIEMIDASTRDKHQIVDHSGCLQKSGDLFRMIADESGLRTKCLRYERPLLAGVQAIVKKSGSQ